MRVLTQDELIELLPATPAQVETCLAAFELAAPILCREPGYVKLLAAEGWIQTNVVAVDSEPAYLIGWHVTPDRGFWFDVVVSVNGRQIPYNQVAAIVEKLAKEKHCRYVRWVTLRRGIAKWARDIGYQAEAVILTKKL